MTATETSEPRAVQTPKLITGAAANVGVRFAGYLIDVIPAMLLGLVAIIPLIGIMVAGCLLAPYWLLRDIVGASLGKLALGLRVVQKDGQPASTKALILRNAPLALGPILMTIPLLGYLLGPPIAGIMILVEGISLMAQGERIGDRLAGTAVVRKQ